MQQLCAAMATQDQNDPCVDLCDNVAEYVIVNDDSNTYIPLCRKHYVERMAYRLQGKEWYL